MKTLKKYKTFEDLKSGEKKATDNNARLEKHKAFEEVIMTINSAKNRKRAVRQSK